MSYALREHTADVAVEATGPTLGAVFAATADGLAAACAESVPGGGERFELTVRAEGREALLFDYLDRLIYERDVRELLPVDNEATVRPPGDGVDDGDGDGVGDGAGNGIGDGDGAGNGIGDGTDDGGEESHGAWTVEASARGVPLAGLAAREVKAVTYSEMDLAETDDGWHAYVVFDV